MPGSHYSIPRHDREIITLKANMKEERNAAEELRNSMKGEIIILKRTVAAVKDDKDSKVGELREAKRNMETAQSKIDDLHRDLTKAHRNLEESRERLRKGQEDIGDLQKQVCQLERVRTLLQHQLRMLRGGIEPKDRKIELMSEQIHELDSEYERSLRVAASMEHQALESTRKTKNLAAACKCEDFQFKWKLGAYWAQPF